MKRNSLIAIVLLVTAMTVSACGGAAPTPAAQPSAASSALPVDYADATSLRNQLALGIMRLENTPQAVTSAQAKQLLPLWQALATLTASSTSATAEVETVQNQIIAALAPEQVAAIAAMQLTNADLQDYYVEIGVTEVRTPEAGTTPAAGSMKNLSTAEKEAARAAAAAAGTPVSGGQGSAKSSVLTDKLMALLSSK